MSDTVALREEERFPLEAVRAWLQQAVPAHVAPDASLEVRRYPAGFSNLTYLLTVRAAHADTRLVLRCPPPGAPGGTAHDMVREHGILAALHPTGLPVPRPVGVCHDPSLLGAPFYVMEHVAGTILRGVPPASLTAAADVLPQRMRALSQSFVDTLARLHAVPLAGPLATLGKPEGYVARQVAGWTKRWEASRTRPVPNMDALAAWLAAHSPPSQVAALVHNDFKFDNLVLDESLSQVRAILDWEMATIGDPLLDLGTALAYWVEEGDPPIFRALGLGITALPGAYTRRELVDAYARASGRDVRHAPFALAFGRFKVAVIAQQIHARYERGHTSDARFAKLGEAVEALAGTGMAET